MSLPVLRRHAALHLVLLGFAILLSTARAHAGITGSIRGLIHDPQHRPMPGAHLVLHASASDWQQGAITDRTGEFRFDTVPLGEYRLTVFEQGFAAEEQHLTVVSGRAVEVHFSLRVATQHELVAVQEAADDVATTPSAVTRSLVSRADITATPGAERANSLAMITDFVPGATLVHDQLHVRGGHQVTFLLDGVPVPNTNIASNVGPQFDPKDVDYLEAQRGGYSAEYGDRTYGVFNVVTRSGFERKREGELVASYGSYHATDNQLSLGDHSERFAWYGSLSGYRANLGLQTPNAPVLNDHAAGLSGFVSLIFNRTPNDQLRLTSSSRGDHYQIPNDPDQQAAGVRDVEDERDSFVNFSWLHTAGPGTVFTVAPFYHFNRAHYTGGPNDVPIPNQDRGSQYVGGVASAAITHASHQLNLGLQVFGQHDNEFFSVVANDGSGSASASRRLQWGNQEVVFAEDQWKPRSWLTLTGGVRLTHYGGAVSENAADPRLGAAVRIPGVNLTLHGSYGRYYQAPPLLTVDGPILELAAEQGFDFLPLHGERDEQYEVGASLPLGSGSHRWTAEGSYFHTAARNFFDHDVLGNSNIFFPLTIDRARIKGWEATLRSPQLWRHASMHLVYSHQRAEGGGAVTGGLTDFTPPDEGLFFLDHDQRDTLNAGTTLELPWRVRGDASVHYGSGFLNGDGPSHLPSYTTADLAFARSFRERWTVGISALNLTNTRYRVDFSNTFGGSHLANGREIFGQVKFRFKF